MDRRIGGDGHKNHQRLAFLMDNKSSLDQKTDKRCEPHQEGDWSALISEAREESQECNGIIEETSCFNQLKESKGPSFQKRKKNSLRSKNLRKLPLKSSQDAVNGKTLLKQQESGWGKRNSKACTENTLINPRHRVPHITKCENPLKRTLNSCKSKVKKCRSEVTLSSDDASLSETKLLEGVCLTNDSSSVPSESWDNWRTHLERYWPIYLGLLGLFSLLIEFISYFGQRFNCHAKFHQSNFHMTFLPWSAALDNCNQNPIAVISTPIKDPLCSDAELYGPTI